MTMTGGKPTLGSPTLGIVQNDTYTIVTEHNKWILKNDNNVEFRMEFDDLNSLQSYLSEHNITSGMFAGDFKDIDIFMEAFNFLNVDKSGE